jgi:hypothetical protein
MSAHTPGPWNMVEASGGWLIGPRETDGPDYVGDVHRLAKGRSDEESEANARLIVAAPELLKGSSRRPAVHQLPRMRAA